MTTRKRSTHPFILQYVGRPQSKELTLHSTCPLYHYVFMCPRCGEIWARIFWTRWPGLKFWSVPTPCPKHGGAGWLDAPFNHFNRKEYLNQLSGEDLRREFLHLTANLTKDFPQ